MGAPRDRDKEREIVELAAQSCGLASRTATGDVLLLGGIDDLERFADQRAGDAPVRPRTPDEWRREIREELADARNYFVWHLQELAPRYFAGDLDAAEFYARALRGLVGVLQAWHALCAP